MVVDMPSNEDFNSLVCVLKDEVNILSMGPPFLMAKI